MDRALSISVIGLCTLVSLAALTLWLSLDPGPAAPTNAEWKVARELIESEYDDGDGIRIHPFWLSGAASVLAINPKGELFDSIDLSLPPDPMYVLRHKRIWLVSAMGRTDWPMPKGMALTYERELPANIVIRRYDVTPTQGLIDLLDLVPAAKLERWGSDVTQKRKCVWDGKKHDCRGRNWENVRVERKQVGGSPRRCVVLHPYPDGGSVAITFPKVKLSGGLLVRAGLTIESARREAGSEVKLTIGVDGDVLREHVVARNEWSWKSLWVDTNARKGETSTVTLTASARREEWRELCFDGYVLPALPPELHR